MKLILEKDNHGMIYLYRENEKQFKRNEKTRSNTLNKLDNLFIQNECDLDFMENGTYSVFELKRS